jgi:hypothetical protein
VPADEPANRIDRRIKVSSDCSFVNGGTFDNHEIVRGLPAEDIGNGRISQIFETVRTCGRQETLLFAECNTREAVLINGAAKGGEQTADGLVLPMPVAGAHEATVYAILAPNGEVRIGPQATVTSVTSDAEREGVVIHRDLNLYLSNMRPRNRFDPLCGCKIYYPDSAGARK